MMFAGNQPLRGAACRKLVLLGATALATTLIGGAAYAQSTEGSAVEEVVVTGSRTSLAGFQAPTPTAVVGSALIEQQAITNIATLLNQQPAFKGLRSPSGTAQNQVSPAQATADLRGVGGQRTLVLVNGNRTVPFASASNLSVPVAVDLNLFPTIMIDRVEVVTGGASAQYGSDAVAGVVNLIMKKRFSGLQVRAQGGAATRGDYHGYRAAVLAGMDFGGKGHVVVAGDFFNNDGVGDSSKREWAASLANVYSNNAFATNGLPALLNIDDVRSALSPGGLITSGPLKGQTFTSATTLGAFNPGTLNNGTVQVGGDGTPPNRGQQLFPEVRTANMFSHLEWEFSPALTAYMDLSYGYSRGILNSLPLAEGGYGGSARIAGTIQGTNPFLPAAVAAAYNGVGGNPTSFSFTKQAFDAGGGGTFVTNKTPRGLIGLEGTFDNLGFGSNWKWNAHAGYGVNHYVGRFTNSQKTGNGTPPAGVPVIPSSVTLALDAVTVTAANVGTSGLAVGSIQCRSRLTDPGNGCVPLNPFGPNTITKEMRNYINGDRASVVFYRQTNAAFNISGEPVKLWAGPLAIAAGFEYRRESEKVKADPYDQVTRNAAGYAGEYDVKEGYLEANLPLAKDMAFAKSLNFQGAVRYADYSTVGSKTTWKMGLNWEPVSGVRFRVTESKDIRAPALWELYSPGMAQLNNITVRNKLNGSLQTVFIPQNSSAGNPQLQAENAKTKTLGVVLSPGDWLEELSGIDISVDYYDIAIKNAVTSFAGANVATLCNSGEQSFCQYFTFDATGTAVALNNPAINLGGLTNRGVDFVVSYRKNLSDWNSKLKGRLTTALSGSYVAHVYIDPGLPGAAIVDRAGDNGQTAQSTGGAQPWLRANLAETYELGKFSGTVQMLYVSKGRLDNTYNNGVPANGINNNKVAPYLNTSLFASYNVRKGFQLFASVQNVFDVAPSRSPYSVLNTAVSGAYYDKVGRAFQIGLDYKF